MPPQTLEFLGVPPVRVHHGLAPLLSRDLISSPAIVQRSSASPDDTYHQDNNLYSDVYVSGLRELPC